MFATLLPIKTLVRRLQLENALYIANLENNALLPEDLRLSRLLEALKPEWDEVQFVLRSDEGLRADKRALLSVLRNIFANAVLHGRAQSIEVRARRLGQGIELAIANNGRPFTGDLGLLGREPLAPANSNSNGLGLYLSSQLLARMGGTLRFERASGGQLTVLLSPEEATNVTPP